MTFSRAALGVSFALALTIVSANVATPFLPASESAGLIVYATAIRSHDGSWDLTLHEVLRGPAQPETLTIHGIDQLFCDLTQGRSYVLLLNEDRTPLSQVACGTENVLLIVEERAASRYCQPFDPQKGRTIDSLRVQFRSQE